MLRLAADELKKSGVRFGDLCQRLQQRLSDPNVFKGADAGFPEGWRAGAPQSLRQTDICKRRPMFRNASYASPVTDLSPAAYALIDDIETALNNSDTPSELASALSPILDDSYALDELDEAGVQAVLSVAQSSFEYWYEDSYAAIIQTRAEADEELTECMNGNMENQQVESDGHTYQCTNMQWNEVRWSRPRPSVQTPLRLVAYSPSTFVPMSCPDPANAHNVITAADYVGAIIGMVSGIPGGPGGMLWASMMEGTSTSIIAGALHAIASWFCNLLS